MRFLLVALLWLITLGTVAVASAETLDELAVLTKQCASGDAGGCVSLGVMYVNGTGVTQDFFKAVELYQKACDGKNAMGCNNLGLMYVDGTGVTQDAVKALELFRKACDGQEANGCANLGDGEAASTK